MEIKIEFIEHHDHHGSVINLMNTWRQLHQELNSVYNINFSKLQAINSKIDIKMRMISSMDSDEIEYLANDFVDAISLYYKKIKLNHT